MRTIIQSWVLLLCLCGLMLTGCADFRKKYPRYPSWGWWDHPAEQASSPEEPSKADEPAQTTEPAAPLPTGRADMPLSDAPALAPATRPTNHPAAPQAKDEPSDVVAINLPVTGEQHRQRVWQRVVELQNLDSLAPARRKIVLAEARRDLPGWYAPLPVDPPKPDSKDWITTLTWDFMPDEDFVAAKIKWKLIAQQQKMTFPEPCSRRDLMQFIQHVTAPQPRE